MRNRKAINLIARNGKAMFGDMTGISEAAKAVILAEYGSVVWSDVKQYAKAHPAIVEFINQDPHLAASISTNSTKIRTIKNNAKGAYFKLPNDYSADKYIEQMWYLPVASNQSSSCGMFGQSKTFSLHPWWHSATQVRGQFNGSEFGINPIITNDYTKFVVPSNESRCITFNSEGVEVNNQVKGSRVPITSPYLFAVNGAGQTLANTGFVYLLVNNEDGSPFEHWMPYQQNGEVGILDAINGVFITPTSGQFTIAITDKE